jgi:hypothetical protein
MSAYGIRNQGAVVGLLSSRLLRLGQELGSVNLGFIDGLQVTVQCCGRYPRCACLPPCDGQDGKRMGQQVVIWRVAVLEHERGSFKIFPRMQLSFRKQSCRRGAAGCVGFSDHGPINLSNAGLPVFLVGLENLLHLWIGDIGVIQKVSSRTVPVGGYGRRSALLSYGQDADPGKSIRNDPLSPVMHNSKVSSSLLSEGFRVVNDRQFCFTALRTIG